MPRALVTGGSRGIGLAVAGALAAAGYDVTTASRTGPGPAGTTHVPCDLSDPADVEALAASVGRGGLDVCVLNAAVRRLAPVAETTEASWRASVETNLGANVALCRLLLPALRRSGGYIVIVGSHAATRFFEGGLAYSATKAGLKALAETLLLEERQHGVRTCLLSPGAVANRAGDISPGKIAPSSVAELVVWLVTAAPADVAFGEIELRPAALRTPPISGMDRLQYV